MREDRQGHGLASDENTIVVRGADLAHDLAHDLIGQINFGDY